MSTNQEAVRDDREGDKIVMGAEQNQHILYHPIEAAEIRRIRQEGGLSQAAFARLLVTHKRTIQRWEAGAMRPTGVSLALLTVVKRRGVQILMLS